ncbi:alkaline phosphatase [Bacillus massiliglaciei]|uniref:alkaline phosphatase n=1 Tax=Bacillus massiliglaciei TaxID=1816693 RepID=UPI000AC1FC52|nr:alkaline phosphatase [Bacillus massiliglaciei]
MKTRRTHYLLACGLIMALLFFCSCPSFAYAETPPAAKNVILLIGDGMGIGQLEIARQFEYGKTGTLNVEKLEHTALMKTYSANNFVTDSAAGGSAIATGVKTKNESLGVDQSGQEVDSILDAFQAAGRKVGLVTTSMVVDATPAAFGASVPNRWTGSADIARQLYHHKIDVILGGGAKFFSPDKQNGQDLVDQFRADGYRFVKNRSELNQLKKTKKLLGLFHPSYMNFKLDREEYHSDEPSLSEMTLKAIETLSQEDRGFFLMAEGGRIDHTAHAADLTGIWKETIEFDQTVQSVMNWAKNKQDTLIIVLADHETMGISATESMNIPALKKLRVSTEYMAKQLKPLRDGTMDPEQTAAIFKKYAQINLSEKEAQHFIEQVKENRGMVYPQHQIDWMIGSTIASWFKAGTAGFSTRSASSTGGHTANMVPIFATGPGSEKINGVLENTDISRIIASAANIPFTPGQLQKE